MKTVGIIAEFNPFHNGHKHIFETIKADGNRVVCVLGDDFTQRGDVALISKYARAEAAIKCGADLCLLMPTPWSMSCAYNFALGGISILNSLGCIDTVAFGSECGDKDKLIRVSKAVHSDDLSPLLREELKDGTTFAKARQNALKKLIGDDADVLSSPNDTLATEYISAAESLNFSPEFWAVKRVGGPHDSKESQNEFLSASAIRDMIKNGNHEQLAQFMPTDSLNILMREVENCKYADIKNLETAILSHLRRLKPDELRCVPEVAEGLENKILSAALNSTTLDNCLENIKSKRYTLARIRRIVMSAFLGIDMTFFGEPVPYIKVLGMNAVGEQILKDAVPSVPLICKSRDYSALKDTAATCFDLQNTASNIYSLSLENKDIGGKEFKTGIIKM